MEHLVALYISNLNPQSLLIWIHIIYIIYQICRGVKIKFQFRFQPLEFRSDWFWFVLLILYSISDDINLHSPQKCFETWTIFDQLNWINLQLLRETNQALDLISHSSHLWGYRTWTGQKSEDGNREINDLKVWGVKRQKLERWKRCFFFRYQDRMTIMMMMIITMGRSQWSGWWGHDVGWQNVAGWGIFASAYHSPLYCKTHGK